MGNHKNPFFSLYSTHMVGVFYLDSNLIPITLKKYIKKKKLLKVFKPFCTLDSSIHLTTIQQICLHRYLAIPLLTHIILLLFVQEQLSLVALYCRACFIPCLFPLPPGCTILDCNISPLIFAFHLFTDVRSQIRHTVIV